MLTMADVVVIALGIVLGKLTWIYIVAMITNGNDKDD